MARPRPVIVGSMAEAVADIPDGVTLIVPGFGGAGMPWNLLTALYERGTTGLTTVSNGIGSPSPDPRVKSLGDLVEAGRVRKVISSFTAATHPSKPSVPEQMVRDGLLEAELVPQGTLAERIRAGGTGVPAFYAAAGVGTMVSEGKEHREIDGRTYVLERAIVADVAFVRAHRADEAGNLVFRFGARNYNPIAAMAARRVIVEVEEPILPAGAIPPDQVHLPGLYVERLVPIGPDGVVHARRDDADAAPAPVAPSSSPSPEGRRRLTREEMGALIAQRLRPGDVVNLGQGIPTTAANHLGPDSGVWCTVDNGMVGYGRLARPDEVDHDVVNPSGQLVTLVPGASFMHHADSFGLIRSGRLDVTVLGAYEVASDGSFANWRLSTAPYDQLGSVGGAMDLTSGARETWIAMEHTTRAGVPRLLERCTLPLTATRGVTLVVTDLGVIAVRDGRFVLEEHAPGYTPEEIAALTAAPLDLSPTLRQVRV